MLVLLTGASALSSVFKLVILLVIFFALLVGARIFTKWYVRSGAAGVKKTSNIEVVESYSISQGRSIVIAKIGGKYVSFVLFKDNASFLTELSEDELEFAAPATGGGKGNFSEMLKKAKEMYAKPKK